MIGVNAAEFHAQAQRRLGAQLRADLDFIFYAADSSAELAKLKSLKKHLQSAGAIWVVSLKGNAATIRDVDVMRAAREAGLVDNKVCSFSATHSALKLVIPVAARCRELSVFLSEPSVRRGRGQRAEKSWAELSGCSRVSPVVSS